MGIAESDETVIPTLKKLAQRQRDEVLLRDQGEPITRSAEDVLVTQAYAWPLRIRRQPVHGESDRRPRVGESDKMAQFLL